MFKDFDAIPKDDYEAAFKAALAFIDHNDKPEDTGGKPPPRVMDWEQDESIMFPAVNKVAGFEVRSARYVHWWTFMGYYMEISDGVFAQVLNLRLKLSLIHISLQRLKYLLLPLYRRLYENRRTDRTGAE